MDSNKRYFEESALMEMLEGMEYWDEPEEVVLDIKETIRTAVPADVEPVRRGTWLDAEESDLIGNPVDAYYCSCCKKAKTGAVRYPRCHICGAIMSNPTCFEDFVI